MPHTRQHQSPRPEPVYSCPRCGLAMKNGVVSVRQGDGVAELPDELAEVVMVSVGRVLSKVGAAMSGGCGPELDFDRAGQERMLVVPSACVRTSYRCDCGVVAIFPVAALDSRGQA
ncbi:hypothetical protein [Haloferula sp. BvORR071]|uniref:hypothetical protein n=1 Tax=Haloferula sp. BvORR071 TaxID=1396141 RepID=UPI002240FCD0|nr:hypothetical protein [Haloferula sp. BvORR071]